MGLLIFVETRSHGEHRAGRWVNVRRRVTILPLHKSKINNHQSRNQPGLFLADSPLRALRLSVVKFPRGPPNLKKPSPPFRVTVQPAAHRNYRMRRLRLRRGKNRVLSLQTCGGSRWRDWGCPCKLERFG